MDSLNLIKWWHWLSHYLDLHPILWKPLFILHRNSCCICNTTDLQLELQMIVDVYLSDWQLKWMTFPKPNSHKQEGEKSMLGAWWPWGGLNATAESWPVLCFYIMESSLLLFLVRNFLQFCSIFYIKLYVIQTIHAI